MTQLYVLFLDDDRTRAEEFSKVCPGAVWVKSAPECERWLSKRIPWDLVCLDHDLDEDMGGRNSGTAVVKWLAEHPKPLPSILIHSWNNVAGPKMAEDLIDLGYQAQWVTFSQNFLCIVKKWYEANQ